jgi:hypothetical protein
LRWRKTTAARVTQNVAPIGGVPARLQGQRIPAGMTGCGLGALDPSKLPFMAVRHDRFVDPSLTMICLSRCVSRSARRELTARVSSG